MIKNPIYNIYEMHFFVISQFIFWKVSLDIKMGFSFIENKSHWISWISVLPSFRAKLLYNVWDGKPCKSQTVKIVPTWNTDTECIVSLKSQSRNVESILQVATNRCVGWHATWVNSRSCPAKDCKSAPLSTLYKLAVLKLIRTIINMINIY